MNNFQNSGLVPFNKFFTIFCIAVVLSVTRGWTDNEVLNAFDHAKTPAQIRQAEQQIQESDSVSKEQLQHYSKDHSKPGRKRYSALRLSLKDLPEDQKWIEIQKVFKTDTDRDFRVNAALDMAASNAVGVRDTLKATYDTPGLDDCVKLVVGSSLASLGDASAKNDALDSVLKTRPCNDFGIATLAKLKATDTIVTLQHESEVNKDPLVKDNCKLAILRIRMEQKSVNEKEGLLHDALLDDEHYRSQRWAARYLAHIGDQGALNILIRILKNPSATSFQKDAAQGGLEAGIEDGVWKSDQISNLLAS